MFETCTTLSIVGQNAGTIRPSKSTCGMLASVVQRRLIREKLEFTRSQRQYSEDNFSVDEIDRAA